MLSKSNLYDPKSDDISMNNLLWLSLYFDDEEFSNSKYQNINQLYDFKKMLQDKKIILPILKDIKENNEAVTFTPINPSDLISLEGLLPAKSTWITPRL